MVRSSFQTDDQPGTFKCARSRCIHNVEKMSGPKRSIKITDHFTCTSANVICCITSFHCKKKFYIGETGRRLGDRFREHLRERNDKDVSKPVARHRLLPTFTSDLREKIRTRASFTNQTFNLCDIVNMFPCWPLLQV